VNVPDARLTVSARLRRRIQDEVADQVDSSVERERRHEASP
jgi:hypothetical protein